MDDPDRESLERRLSAVERALSDGDPIEYQDRLVELEERIAELEAAVEALRGYVGTVRAINEDVERRADLALRKASALERRVGDSNRCDDVAGDDEDAEGGTELSGRLRRLGGVL